MKASRIIAGAAAAAVLGVAYYALSPLFQTTVVDDVAPSVSATASSGPYPVIGTTGHPASGVVRVIDNEGEIIIRYEDFSTINGPNLHLYLAKDLGADEFVDLGPIHGTEGNINYAVPKDIDINEYRYVMYWCVPFGVVFNYADLNMK